MGGYGYALTAWVGHGWSKPAYLQPWVPHGHRCHTRCRTLVHSQHTLHWCRCQCCGCHLSKKIRTGMLLDIPGKHQEWNSWLACKRCPTCWVCTRNLFYGLADKLYSSHRPEWNSNDWHRQDASLSCQQDTCSIRPLCKPSNMQHSSESNAHSAAIFIGGTSR